MFRLATHIIVLGNVVTTSLDRYESVIKWYSNWINYQRYNREIYLSESCPHRVSYVETNKATNNQYRIFVTLKIIVIKKEITVNIAKQRISIVVAIKLFDPTSVFM